MKTSLCSTTHLSPDWKEQPGLAVSARTHNYVSLPLSKTQQSDRQMGQGEVIQLIVVPKRLREGCCFVPRPCNNRS